MKKKILRTAKQYVKQDRRQRNWRKLVRVMACVVVFCTTYALILPAITMERDTCSLTEHIHSESCYEKVLSESVAVLACDYDTLDMHVHTADCLDAQGNPVCGEADYLVHTHSGECLNANGALVCRIPEVEEHEHSEDCYGVVETEPAETETAEATEATEAEETQPAEPDGDKEEAAVPELICGKEEISLHSHDEEHCYETYLDEEGNEQKRLICTQVVVLEHKHGEGCYVTEEAAVETADVLICGLEEHTHTDECNAAEEIKGTLVPVVTDPPATEPGISLMGEIPRVCLKEPVLIDGSNVTWAVYTEGSKEYILRFDGEGPIPDCGTATIRPWYDYVNKLEIPVHLEFGENVTAVGSYSLTSVKIASIEWGGITKIGAYGFSYGSGPANFEVSGNVKIIGSFAFGNRGGIEKLVLHDGIETLDSSAIFTTVSSGTPVNIPASVTSIKGAPSARGTVYTVDDKNPNYCAVDGVLFTKDMETLVDYPTVLKVDEYRIPDGVKTASFGSAEIGKLIIPPSLTTLPGRFAQSARINEIYFLDGSQLNEVGDSLWAAAYGLTNIRYPENTAIPLHSLFKGSTLDRYTHFTVPNKITSIGYLEGTLRNLGTVTYNAENAEITTEQLFNECAEYDLIVDQEVNHLPEKFFCFVSPARAVYFRGENTFTADSGAFKGAGEPLESLSGKFYVDANGVLYQCVENDGVKTARVVYASPDAPADLTIPATVQTSEIFVLEDGTEYTVTEEYAVTAVGTKTFCSAENLVSLTFDAPEQITELGAYAMANCPTLQSVNGQSTKEAAEAEFPNVTDEKKGVNLFSNTGLERLVGDLDGDGILDGIGGKNLTVKHDGAMNFDIRVQSVGGTMEWVEKENGTGLYHLLTGDTLTITAGVDNTNGTEAFVYRVYIRTTGEDCTLSLLPGQSEVYDDHTVICYKTEDPYITYLEFHPIVGASVDVPLTAVYPKDVSAGGGLEIWGVILPREDARKENYYEKVVSSTNENEVIRAHWATLRETFQVTKKGSGIDRSIISDRIGGGKPDGSLSWAIDLTHKVENTTGFGHDFAESVFFTDIITLPEGFSWNPKLVEALKNGPMSPTTISQTDNNFEIGGLAVATVSQNKNSASTKYMEAYWHEYEQDGEKKGTLAFRWELHNTGEDEMYNTTVNVIIPADAISIDMSKIDVSIPNTVRNDVTAEVHYHHSEPVMLPVASAEIIVKGGTAALALQKTSSGVTYFGEDVTYTIDLYNKGAVPFEGVEGAAYTAVESLSKHLYIKPEKMEEMFGLYGSDLTITISDAVLAEWVEVMPAIDTTDGEEKAKAWQNSGNSNGGSPGHTLQISLTEEGKYQVVVDNTTTYIADTVAQALYDADYAVTESATYVCTWALHEPNTIFTIDSVEHRFFSIYATAKDSFGMITEDWPNSYSSDETVTATATTRVFHSKSSRQVTYAAVTDYVKREAHVAKSVYTGNDEQYDGGRISDGDVLTYHLDFCHYGTGDYANLPMVDDLYGSQYLLVPAVDANGHLKTEYGLEPETIDGVSYYVLRERESDDPDHVTEYKNVTVGVDDEGYSLVAAFITVGKATDEVQVELGGIEHTYSGIHTRIKWYFSEKAGGDYWMQVRYNALVDLSVNEAAYTIGNVVWMNDRENTRIYDFIWGAGTIIEFRKDIVTQKPGIYANDVLAEDKYSQIPRGGQVLYRLTLHNTGDSPFLLPGEQLADGLPETFDIFTWNKDDEDLPVNVAFSGVEVEGEEVKVLWQDEEFSPEKLGDVWSIADSYTGLIDENRQYIVWPSDLKIQFSGSSTLYLYFTLTYPDNPENGGADLWNQYTAAAGGNRIFNTLYVYRFPSTVEHDLEEPGKVLLQKGVSGMYHFMPSGGSAPDFYYHAAGTSRMIYNNEDMRARAVMYYVTLYNGGSKRLYLDEYLYDQLPKGFSYYEMIKGSPLNQSIKNRDHRIVTDGGVFPEGNGITEFIGESVVYRSATVTADPTDNGIIFRISDGEGDYALRYDAQKGKHYLNAGEAIVFKYTCRIGNTVDTEDVATNTVAMPYHDYLNTGLTTISKEDLPVHAEELMPFQDTNDGSRSVMSNQDVVDTYQFPSSNESHWLVSDVTVERGEIVPGVLKYTEAYTPEGGTRKTYEYGALPNAVIEWRVRLHNAGTEALVNYTFSDIMPKPYAFVGKIIFRYYDVIANYDSTVKPFHEQTIATIPQRNPDGSLSIEKQDVGYGISMSIGKDENGNEVLTLECKTNKTAIPEGGYVDVILYSENIVGDHKHTVYTNRATLHPNVQTFENVHSGTMLRDEQGNPIGVESYSPVNITFGYATRSEKRVTEYGKEENTAVSKEIDKNRIFLGSATDTFIYTLTVGNETPEPMTKLVIIDNLPGEGDHMSFDTTTPRRSDFNVYFADEPAFTVKITDNKGEWTELDDDQYRLEFSYVTDFGGPHSDDWKGIVSEDDKWSSWDAWSVLNDEQKKDVRAFRLIITDDSATWIPPESQIDITFKARADQTAEPGMVAWNSFGYHCALKDEPRELEAMPLVVGVAIPDIPAVKKQLISEEGNAVKAPQDQEFRFLVYEGAALTGSYDSPEAFCEALDHAGRKYQVVTVPVAQGQTESAAVMLDDVPWTWSHGSKYTVAELDPGDNFSFHRFEGTNDAQRTIIFDAGYGHTVVCENLMEVWSIQVTKTDVEGNPLSGAVFGLYGPSEEGRLGENEAGQFKAPLTATVILEDGTEESWYLKTIAASDAEGKLAFTELREDFYYLLEIKAPDGYNLPQTGQIVYQRDSVDGVRDLQVINEPGYELPETGGMGTTMFYIFGGIMMLASVVLPVNKKRMTDAV